MPENLEKFRSTERYGAPLEGSTIFKLSISEAEICSFSMIGQKNKKITALLIFSAENLQKYSSTELYDAPLEGSTIFLYHSSTSRTSLVSSGLAELKCAFFSRTGRITKKLRRSNTFQLTIYKHGLLEGLTILLQYSLISRTKLESSLLGELKCAISAGYDVILKNKSI